MLQRPSGGIEKMQRRFVRGASTRVRNRSGSLPASSSSGGIRTATKNAYFKPVKQVTKFRSKG